MIANYVFAGLVAFVSVFFKAFQNRNYNYNDYHLVIPTSWFIAGCELYLLSMFIREGVTIIHVFVIGTASGIGGILAMHVHSKYFMKGKSDG